MDLIVITKIVVILMFAGCTVVIIAGRKIGDHAIRRFLIFASCPLLIMGLLLCFCDIQGIISGKEEERVYEIEYDDPTAAARQVPPVSAMSASDSMDFSYMEEQKPEQNTEITEILTVDGVPVTQINIPDEWNPLYSEHFISCSPDFNTFVSYQDSGIAVGDTEAIEKEALFLQDTYDIKTNITSFKYYGVGYVITYDTANARNARVYEPVPGASTYMEIQITDYTGMRNTQGIIQTYSITF